jgi:hypothetical protein
VLTHAPKFIEGVDAADRELAAGETVLLADPSKHQEQQHRFR